MYWYEPKRWDCFRCRLPALIHPELIGGVAPMGEGKIKLLQKVLKLQAKKRRRHVAAKDEGEVARVEVRMEHTRRLLDELNQRNSAD